MWGFQGKSSMEKIPKTVLNVKVLPKSSRDEVIGMEEGICRVKIKAPPVDGKANKALIKVLADKFNLPKKKIEIISGWTSRFKRVRIHGLRSKDVVSLISRKSL